MNTKLARAVDGHDDGSKEKLHFDDQSKQVVFMFSLQNLLKE